MRTQAGSVFVQGAAVLTILAVPTIWLITAPTLVTPTNLLSMAALLTALAGLARTVYRNSQSSSIGQVLYDTENAGRSEEAVGQPRNHR